MLGKEELKEVIETAFRGVALDGGLSLEQTKIIDTYGRGFTTEQFSNLPNKEVIDDWQKIPVFILDEADCIAHLDQKGFRYYIPALMLRLLDDYDPTSMMSIGTINFLYPKSIDKEYLYSELSIRQCRAIALYLENLPNLTELGKEDETRVKRALDKYWSRFYIRNSIDKSSKLRQLDTLRVNPVNCELDILTAF